tara:strand:- start:68 stop:355 length:288 start_codon:yes stop_codon:yes gene_type:complete
MEDFKLSDQEEEYFSNTLETDSGIKRVEKLENRMNFIEQKMYNVDQHQEEITKIYEKIMDLENKILNLEQEEGNVFFDTLDELWEDFKNFVKYKL